MAKFNKGTSGNPRGRPKGSRNMATIRADELFEQMLFGEDKKADAIIAKTISMAEEGDTACIRLCLIGLRRRARIARSVSRCLK